MSEYIKMDEGLRSRREGLPKEIITEAGVTFDPIVEQCESILWRRIAETIPPPEGMQATAWEVQEIDAHDCKVVCVSWVDPVEEAEKAKQARIARFMALTSMVGLASLYRATLREYFGKDAETNRAVTKDAVVAYFIGLQQSQTITAQQLADGNFLDISFTSLTNVWGPDSTGVLSTWELPWELIP
jgi:hypothetical protein